MSRPVEKQEWFQVAAAFEASGLTQKEFSAQRGLRLSTLQSWVYRRRRQHARKVQQVRLLPVEVSTVAQASPALLEVVLTIGARLRFPAGADVDYVARLVTALGR
ncbi:IS66 family insertion sequence element accessory protein TnpB [Corallococcus sp. Z5C101001]|uniref:IS66 family insertion sequence element accessory protein TnpA n=1 Tax=Corallococcus sp. Z5C101001 TaxID=2596829 RepID=UPI001180D4C6|nr:IS66 family insertion sequence element accessory protein TnpB [Corallococcus sp. Z5C101001]TSC20970.1 IS66 family insertion sequence element accessory protein TnpB [Corallococcus sp. Z5C101001]